MFLSISRRFRLTILSTRVPSARVLSPNSHRPHIPSTSPIGSIGLQMPSPTSVTLAAHAHANAEKPLKCAYITFLLTSPSYLPGILVLAHTLRQPTTTSSSETGSSGGSAYPLIVAVNPALPKECIKALTDAGIQVRVVEPLVPVGPVTIIAERFVDTWTKLRVWEFEEFDVSASVCFGFGCGRIGWREREERCGMAGGGLMRWVFYGRFEIRARKLVRWSAYAARPIPIIEIIGTYAPRHKTINPSSSNAFHPMCAVRDNPTKPSTGGQRKQG